MPHIYEGDKNAAHQHCFAIVASRYNPSVTARLLEGALDTLRQHGVDDDHIDVAWVPGAWEIPLVARRLANSARYVAILCIGAVIRGETTHDQYINRQVSHSLGSIAIETGLPILFGVLTCETLEQAIHRSGGRAGHKGVECAEAALEMADLMSKLPT